MSGKVFKSMEELPSLWVTILGMLDCPRDGWRALWEWWMWSFGWWVTILRIVGDHSFDSGWLFLLMLGDSYWYMWGLSLHFDTLEGSNFGTVWPILNLLYNSDKKQIKTNIVGIATFWLTTELIRCLRFRWGGGDTAHSIFGHLVRCSN